MVEAGGVGIFRAIEDTELIEKSTRSKRSRIGNCAQLERIWNAEFWPVQTISCVEMVWGRRLAWRPIRPGEFVPSCRQPRMCGARV